MPTPQSPVQRDARTELHAWYFASLRPKLARAARTGVVPQAAAEALDQQVRDFLDVPFGAAREAA